MAWYRTGTINLTNGSAAIVGVGTDFISGAAVGEGLQAPDGRVYEISSIQSATALTLGSIYLGSTVSTQAYTIAPTQSYIRDLASQAATLVNSFVAVRDGVGAGKFDKGTLALPGISFVGDSNTGIRHTTAVADGTGALAADSFALVANGVDQATVDVNGLTVRALNVTGALNAGGAIAGSNLSGTNTGDQNLSAMVTLTGAQTLTNKTLTAPVIDAINATPIGGTTPAAGAFTTLNATGTINAAASISFNQTGSATRKASIFSGASVSNQLQIYSGTDASNVAQPIIFKSGDINTASTDIVTMNQGSVAVTGNLSATGAIKLAANNTYLQGTTTGSVSQNLLGLGGDNNTYIFSGTGKTVELWANGGGVGSFSSTGLAVTGALSATGGMAPGQTVAGVGISMTSSSAIRNAGHTYYDVGTSGTGDHNFRQGAALDTRATISSTGLAVTGALSASGDVSLGGNALTVSNTATAATLFAKNTTNGFGAYLQWNNSLGAVRMGTDNNYPVRIIQNAVDRAEFSSTGLAVTGALSATGSISAGTSLVANNGTINASISNDGTNGLIGTFSNHPFALYTNSSIKATLNAAGNLGLGVTPSAWGGGFKGIQLGATGALRSASGNTAICENNYYDGTNNRYLTTSFASNYSQAGGNHYWFNAPSGTAGNPITFTQAMTLDASGNLLVGSTAAVSATQTGIQLVGTDKTLRICATTGTTNTTSAYFYNGNGIVGSITTSGSATAYNTSSDYRLKNITGPITTSGSYIDSLNPVEGTWKADGSTFVGLLAHEAQASSRTNIATGTKDGEDMQAMDYSSSELIANLVKEVQSLRTRVAQLEGV